MGTSDSSLRQGRLLLQLGIMQGIFLMVAGLL
jgi:hypothetical protein